MTKFNFATDVAVSGIFGAYAHAQGEIELSDEEIDVLIRLMRQDRTTMDYKKLNLEEADPGLYEKIDHAYLDAAYEAEGHYIINACVRESDFGFEYDTANLILYCRDQCGYKKRSKGDTILKSDVYDFDWWLSNYIDSLKVDDALDFLEEHTLTGLDLSDEELGAAHTCNLPHKLKKIEKSWKG